MWKKNETACPSPYWNTTWALLGFFWGGRGKGLGHIQSVQGLFLNISSEIIPGSLFLGIWLELGCTRQALSLLNFNIKHAKSFSHLELFSLPGIYYLLGFIGPFFPLVQVCLPCKPCDVISVSFLLASSPRGGETYGRGSDEVLR